MPRTEVLNKVPADRLSQVVADFESEGAKVTTKKENGTFTVTAVFPDSAGPKKPRS